MSACADISASRGRHRNRADRLIAAQRVANWPARPLRTHCDTEPRSPNRGDALMSFAMTCVITELYVLAMLVLLVSLLGMSAAATGVFH
jgi:hypothetical protein